MKNQISEFLQSRIEARDFPSAVYLVAEKGQIVLQDALGLAVVEPEKIKATIGTIYDLASLTKVLVTGLLCAPAQDKSQGKPSDKEKNAWARWKAGSFAKYRVTGEALGEKKEQIWIDTLTAVSDGGYTLKHTLDAEGDARVFEESKDLDRSDGLPVSNLKEVRREDLTINGKKFPTIVKEGTSQTWDATRSDTVWCSKESGENLKSLTKIESAIKEKNWSMVIEMAVTHTDVEMTVAGRKLKCIRMKVTQTQKGEGMEHQSTQLISASRDVPGGTVREETSTTMDGTTTTSLKELIDFGVGR